MGLVGRKHRRNLGRGPTFLSRFRGRHRLECPRRRPPTTVPPAQPRPSPSPPPIVLAPPDPYLSSTTALTCLLTNVLAPCHRGARSKTQARPCALSSDKCSGPAAHRTEHQLPACTAREPLAILPDSSPGPRHSLSHSMSHMTALKHPLLFQTCSLIPPLSRLDLVTPFYQMEYDRKDSARLRRVGPKRHCSFLPALLDPLFQGQPAAML